MGKRWTQQEFIDKAISVHGNQYDYSKTKYRKSTEKVIIICLIHGEFKQIAAEHIRGKGCSKCACANNRLTTQQFIDKANIIHSNRYNYNKSFYITNKDKLIITCEKHGDFEQLPMAHLRGHGCQKCNLDNRRLGTKNFIEKAKIVHGNRYNYDKVNYNTNDENVIITCLIHGDFYMQPNNHLHGGNCKLCNYESYTMSLEEFKNKASSIHNSKYNYDKVNYINNKTNIIITCLKHGDFYQTPNSHLRGEGCPKCILKSQNKLFEKLKVSFSKEEIKWEESPTWLQKQRFDIYFPKYNLAVEYNGKQHYVPNLHFGGKLGFQETIQRDELKKQKCRDNNCILFEVKYDYNENDYEELVSSINSIIKLKQKQNEN